MAIGSKISLDFDKRRGKGGGGGEEGGMGGEKRDGIGYGKKSISVDFGFT